MKNTFKMGISTLIILVVSGSCEIGHASENVKINPSAPPETMAGETGLLYSNWQELKKRNLRLLPVPKKIEFTTPPVDAKEITVVLENKTRQGEIAANEIVSRIKTLSGKTIPIVSSPEKGKFNVIIKNVFPNFFTKKQADSVKTVNPYCRKQAYGIEIIPEGIKLAGNTPIGTMYAAVTLRWLIENKGGKTVLYPANVTDWPDFSRRMIKGSSGSEVIAHFKKQGLSYAEFKKGLYDWAFRLKINMIYRPTVTPYGVSPFPKDTKKWLKENKWVKKMVPYFKYCRELGEYLRDRDIRSMDNNFVYLGTVSENSHRQEVKGCAVCVVGKGACYFSWGRDDLHKSKAEKIALFARRAGYSDIFMHGVDTNQFNDPESWSQRDEFTRKKYGNDRAAATLGLYQIYYDEFRKNGIDLTLVLLPYYPDIFNPDIWMEQKNIAKTPENYKKVKSTIKKLSDYMTEVCEKLPRDIPICLRESARPETLNFYKLIKGHPAFIYFEESSDPRIIGTRFMPGTIASFHEMYDPKRKQDDIFWWISGAGMQGNVCMAEYTWNTKFPGHEKLKPRWKRFALDEYDPQKRAIMGERAAVGLWGDKYGQILKPMMCNDLSLMYPFFDRNAKRWPKYSKYFKNLKRNKKFLEIADKALDNAWETGIKNRKKGNDLSTELSIEYLIALRNVIKIAIFANAVNFSIESAKQKILKGKKAEAEALIDNVLKRLPSAQDQYEKKLDEMKGLFDPCFSYFNMLMNKMRGNLNISYFNKQKTRLEKLKKNMDQLYQLSYSPKWYRRYMWRKELQVSMTKDTLTIDGNLNESAWESAFPIENFLKLRSLTPPPRPIIMKMICDGNNIYIGGEISQPLVEKIKERKRNRNVYRLNESVELFLQPDSKKSLYFQYIIDTVGNIYSVKIPEMGDISPVMTTQSTGASRVKDGKWTFELKIPLTELGARPGKNWKGLLCYNSAQDLKHRPFVDHYASAWVSNSYHAESYWGKINFEPSKNQPLFKFNMNLESSSIKSVTLATGTGSVVKFKFFIKTYRPVYDLKITAEITDSLGRKLCEPFEIANKKFTSATLPTINLEKQLDIACNKVKLSLTATFHTSDNKKYSKKRDFVIGD